MSPSRQRERELERARRERQALRRALARRRARRRNAAIGAVLATLIVVGGVIFLGYRLSRDDQPLTPAAGRTPTSAPSTAATPFPPLPPGADPRLATKPVVSVPKGPPPKRLRVKDLIVGRGGVAKAGRQLTVNYVGVGYPDGKEFDSSWKAKRAFPFPLGKGQVIKGWDQGLVGMKVGGRRQLVIPAGLAYGSAGRPPTIRPNEPLVFVVDLLALGAA